MPSAQPRTQAPLTDSERRWLEVREYLDAHRFELGRDATAAYPDVERLGPTPLLAPARWVPTTPLLLDTVILDLNDGSRSAGAAWLADRAAPVVLPERPDGGRYESYSDALAQLTGRKFENRQTYRLRYADLRPIAPTLRFGLGTYFDHLDIGEACAHEFAAAQLDLLDPAEQRIRATVGDPCDPDRRPVNLAISTLTLRFDRKSGEATFLMHRRDPEKVGHAAGLYQVLPTGVFQAAGEARWNMLNDFSLWRSMVREYSEEFLGESEDYGAERAPINYDAWPLAARMKHGLDRGDIRTHVLGLGVDPLTLATDLLTVVVIDADLYDELFHGAVALNEEGEVVSSLDGASTSHGVPFSRDVVGRFVRDEPIQAAGAALLWSAWKERRVLLG
jgi:hypothetical protein